MKTLPLVLISAFQFLSFSAFSQESFTRSGQEAVAEETTATCGGAFLSNIPFPFPDYYSCTDLGAAPGVITPYGGLTFKYDDPNTIVIGGAANDATGRIYQIGVNRDANKHIIGFSGTARLYPGPTSRIGQYNDGGVVFGPENVLFVTRYPDNQLEQSKPGSNTANKVTDLTPLGVTSSVGSVGFVPQGFSGAGKMKLVSFPGGNWYDANYTQDGTGTFNINSATLRTNVGDAEGIAFVPAGLPGFPANSALIAKYNSERIVIAALDSNGDPVPGSLRDFLLGLSGAEGAAIDPLTGDFLFGTSGPQNKLIAVAMSAATPTPTPTPTATPSATPTATPAPIATPSPTPPQCHFHVLIVFSDYSGHHQPMQMRDEIFEDRDVAGADLFDALAGTPTLAQLQQYDIVMVSHNGSFYDGTLLGNNLAAYVDAGGVVVECATSFDSAALKGRWVSDSYNPFDGSTTGGGVTEYGAYIHDRGHPLMAGITSLTFTFLEGVTIPTGSTRLASALPGGTPLVAYRSVGGGHTTVGISAFLGFDGDQAGDWAKLIVNAGRWLRPCGTTPTPTPGPTATATPTATPTVAPTATPTVAPTATATATPTASPPATATPTATAIPTATPPATPTATPTPDSHLANISTRMRVGAGDDVLIAGFIVEGDADKRVIIRGIGPSLAAFGVTDALPNPTLALIGSDGALIKDNDNWPDNDNAAEIIATGLAPGNAYESALLLSLAPGSYTAVLRGPSGATGIGLVEVYNLDTDGAAKIVNISTRGLVLTGENVMIGGFIITGTDASQLVVRALGPSLGAFGVPDPLGDPFLEIRDGNGTPIQTNNNWRDNQEADLQTTGLAPTNDLESAILISVAPGNYTAIVKGADGGTGNGLVEVYKLVP